MKKVFLYFVITVLIFCLGWQTSRLFNRQNSQGVLEKSMQHSIQSYDDEAEISAELNGILLDPDSTILLDYQGRRVPVDSLIAISGIIARYSATGCRPCINSLTESLQQYAAENPDSTIWVLIKNIALRDLYVMAPE